MLQTSLATSVHQGPLRHLTNVPFDTNNARLSNTTTPPREAAKLWYKNHNQSNTSNPQNQHISPIPHNFSHSFNTMTNYSRSRLSPLIKTKMHLNRFLNRFKRKISVVEMTEPPHPSLDDFLAQRSPDLTVEDDDDDGSLSMCSTCQDKMQIQEDTDITAKSPTEKDPRSPKSPPFSLSRVSLIFVPGVGVTPKEAQRNPAILGSTIRASANISIPQVLEEDRRESKDTVMASPSALCRTFRDGYVPGNHPALFDLPPPFSRHSDPTYREGPAKRVELVRQASQQKPRAGLEDEAEELATRLAETEYELSETTQQLEKTMEELAAREESFDKMRSKDIELSDRLESHERNQQATVLELQGLQREIARYEQQSQVSSRKIQSLLKCRKHRHCRLREQVVHLTEKLQTTERKLSHLAQATRFQDSLFTTETHALRQSNSNLHSQNQKLETLAQDLQSQVQDLQTSNERLGAYIQDLESQRSSEEDIAATQMAEREVYVVHERLRSCERELGMRRVSLEVVRQSNRDLSAEIACLKGRLRERGRYTV